MKNTSLKDKLNNNELTIGSWVTIGHTSIPEILSGAGFEWLVIDIEHNSIDPSMVQSLISTIQSYNIAALVRVSKNDEVIIKHVMDAGADGVVIPMICSREDAEKAVSYVRYPPSGTRGVGLSRAQGYGNSFNEYKNWLDEFSVVIAQIEHINAVRNFGEIISTQGIDGIIIGPPLYYFLLIIPFFRNIDYLNAIEQIEYQCKMNNFPLGVHVVQPEAGLLSDKINNGYTFLAFSTDFLFMGNNAKEKLKHIKSNP